MEFNKFKIAVAQQFNKMAEHNLYRTQVEKDQMWDIYLGSFPAGTNPVYRTRTEYDCSCCRQFIRAVGNVVAIIDNQLVSIWDVAVDEPAFQTVADALSALVKSKPVENIFLHTERTAGTDKNFEQIVGGMQTWEHFFVNIPQKYVARNTEIGTALSEARALHDVMLRSLNELTDDAVDTVLDLIAQNSLYRGEEHKFAVESFKKLKKEYASYIRRGGRSIFKTINPESVAYGLERVNLSEKAYGVGMPNNEALAQDNFVWDQITKVPASVAKIRNTSIGTLLTDLSEGRDLEEAVKAFETMVAPANYKRPTALVTKAMVENARNKVDELGLTTALERRYAALSDININDILFADRSAKPKINGSVFDEIANETADRKPKNMDKIEEVHIEKFLADILPNASSLELMMENSHIKNLVSLVAPVDPTAGQLFKWKNNFSWAYKGDVADSIRERVKKAGGNVTGELCCRLAWYNYDDLDFHMIEPDGYEIFYRNKRELSHSGGMLDVDMNAGMGTTREPVENIFYSTQQRMKEGIYKLQVHQFRKQETDNEGFEVEFDFMGETKQYAYEKPVRQDETITVVEFRYSKKDGVKIINSLPLSTLSKNEWEINTNSFHKVNVMMLSPNHWESSGSGVGNKHYFFMLDGCVNNESARGFFNEFLKEELNEHRKVFEIVGSKMKTAESAEQLSGIGFSSTQRNSILCRVSGSFNRIIKIIF